jgi:hypothetical protein
MIVGSLLVNLASVLTACWVAFRRAGPATGALAAVLAGGVLWAEGTALLTDPISSNAGGIPLLALAALAWAVIDGDHRLLPLTAVFAAWVGQQHLAIAAPAASMAALAVVGVVVHEVTTRWRVRAAAEVAAPDADADADAETKTDVADAESSGAEVPDADQDADADAAPVAARRWPWYVGAAGVSLVLWFPVLWQQLTGDPGNVTAVLKYAGASDTPPIGGFAGLRQAVRALGLPPLLMRSDLGGQDFFRGPLGVGEVLAAVAGYGVLAATVVWAWARRRTLALLALTALALAGAGALNGAKIPSSIEAFRINFYRWSFVVAWLAWLAYGWLAAIGVRAMADRLAPAPAVPRRFAPLVPALAVVALLVPIGAVAFTHPGWDDERRDQVGFPMMRDLGDAANRAAAGKGRVTLVLRGSSANLSTGPAVALALVHEGHEVRVDTVVAPGIEDRFWGDHRILHPGDDPGDVIFLLASGRHEVPELPGRRIAHVALNEVQTAALAILVPQARAADAVASPRAEALIAERYGERDRAYVRDHVMTEIAAEPAKLLTDPEVLSMIIDGYYLSPPFDQAALLRLQSVLPAEDVNLDDVFELRVLTRAELADVVPAWAGD